MSRIARMLATHVEDSTMFESRHEDVRAPADCIQTTDFWQETRSVRWVHTSLHRVLALPITASTFTASPSRITGAGARWKKFMQTLA